MNALQRWTLAVLELDDYTCQLCGTCKHLDAHHIIPRSQDPSKALDPANGITLCRRDHAYFEAHRDEFKQWLAHWQTHGRLAGYWFRHEPARTIEQIMKASAQNKRTTNTFTEDWIRQQNLKLE